MSLPSRINELVQHFTQHIDSFKGSNYNETRARIEFIDPFFKELGWDIENTQGFAEAYKDVIHEDAIKVEGSTKAPDYSFRIGGQRKFFLEAKKPSVNVKDDIAPAYQLRRYAWNAGLPVSILTDFEEFAIYDTTIRPNAKDKASTARIFYCTFSEYAEHWNYIASIFSKDAILKGSFDQFVKDSKKKKGTTAVDKEFLKEMEKWRTDLAKNIALRNTIDIHGLNYVVQATIDRILFLRICEDRNIEEYGRLQKVSAKTHIYKQLVAIFEQADQKYNSGLFHFHKEKTVPSAPDEISLGLKIDDKILKDIITALYYPSPYEFSVISADILGNVYEQFLGKVIRLTSGGQAKVEEKPEVKKAGGVYYTPQYIVKYVVENTVGELLKNKTPMIVAGKLKGHAPMRVLDPACGSGSFLIYAYQYLLDWHRDWYEKDIKQKGEAQAKKWHEAVYQGPGNHWYLTTQEKKRILVNNIFGVDIDHQAVEVTKLNLLLKVLEGENRETLGTNLKLFQERALPDLSANIKCGNSLISSDFYSSQGKTQQQLFKVDDDEKYRVNAFDWQNEFPTIFSTGGFDALIGNPPWGAEFSGPIKSYLIQKHPEVPTKTKDSYFYFLSRGREILKPGLLLGYVLPNTWLLINNAAEYRRKLLQYDIFEIVDYGDSVFKDAIVESTTIVLRNQLNLERPCSVKRFKKGQIITEQFVDKSIWLEDQLARITLENNAVFNDLIRKLNSMSEPFGANCEIIFGIKPYQVGYGKPPQTRQDVDQRIYHSPKKINAHWKPLIVGGDIDRYVTRYTNQEFIKYGEWLMYPSNEAKIKAPKILLRRTSDNIRASLDTEGYYPQNSLFILTSHTHSLLFLLGILNSRLINFIYKLKCPQTGKIFAEIKPSIIKELPIRLISEGDMQLNARRDQIVALVKELLSLNKQAEVKTATPTQSAQLDRQIQATNREIDRLVYELYELTAEEIKIVEGPA